MSDQATGLLSPWLRRRRLVEVARHVEAPHRVLDFGCGNGELCRYVAPADYLGVDIDAETIDEARQRNPQGRFELSVPRDTRVDRIVAAAVIEHLPDPGEWLREMGGYLLPAGRVIVTTPHPLSNWPYRLAAALRLTSRQAADEHEQMIGLKQMSALAERAGFIVMRRRRFLFGLNQLFVLGRPSEGE